MFNKTITIALIAGLSLLTSCQPAGQSENASSGINSFASQDMQSLSTQIVNCHFNGTEIPYNELIVAYQNPTVLPGETCVSEVRQCLEGGVLSGSFQYASCEVGVPKDCLFNGVTIKHGEAVTAYTSSTVAFGQSCATVTETRTCNNGILSGSAQYASCSVNSPRACLFDGKTIEHGLSIVAFQTSSAAYGDKCNQEIRTCNDGTLSGSFAFGSCAVAQPASCLFDGKTIAHGQIVEAFQTASVAYGETCVSQSRTCSNGVLSGDYENGACVVAAPASCVFDNKTVLHGESVIAYNEMHVGYGQSCVSEIRTCKNGVLTGSLTASSCSVDQPVNCSLNGQIVLHGTSVVAYPTSVVPSGSQCIGETRLCENGILSGSATSSTCTVDVPVDIGQPKNCDFNGVTVTAGDSILAYQSSTVSYGQTCLSEKRTCKDGLLSGTYIAQSCTVESPKSCELNGEVIPHGGSVTAFVTSHVAYGQICQSEVRYCVNGILSGTAQAKSCVVDPKIPDDGGGNNQCLSKKIIWEFPDVCKGNCGKGVGYFKSRFSLDAGKTWTTLYKNRLPDDLKQLWKVMIDKYGKNSCERPKVDYVKSKNKGYVVMNIAASVPCDLCKYVEVEVKHHGHGMCHKNKEKKKVLKLICGPKKDHHDHDDDDHDNHHIEHSSHHDNHHNSHHSKK